MCQDHFVELPSQISIMQRSRTVARVSSGDPIFEVELIIMFRDLRAMRCCEQAVLQSLSVWENKATFVLVRQSSLQDLGIHSS